MSSPYVYTPHPSYGLMTQYLNGGQSHTQASPFIPNSPLYPTTSPYASPYAPPTELPDTFGTPRRVHFGDDINFPYEGYERQRRPSWHGAAVPPVSPGIIPPSSPYLQPDQSSFFSRRHSFGAESAPPPLWQQSPGPYAGYPSPGLLSPWGAAFPLQPIQFQIHPWLNGESPRGDFIFDISAPSFSPMRLVGPGQRVPLTMEDLQQPATHPPIHRLSMVSDGAKDWPINLEYNPYQVDANGNRHQVYPSTAQTPIKLGDILVAMHREFNERISNLDWAKLTMSEERAISRAYVRRCRKSGPNEMYERAQGVKRVDFLLDRVWFKGLVRAGDSWENVKIITG
ncbi:hypothetical protein HGRIS_011900 [Hohenbuehelia grisea]|uniref:DUF6699 domain-containing protein n=1 Tax=Hohenbuehelia grisea TaxID=104357 RepID=A0ABR3JYQ4_9AGAR